MIVILMAFLLLYLAYEQHCKTKRVEAISKMDWLTYDEIEDLIIKAKE